MTVPSHSTDEGRFRRTFAQLVARGCIVWAPRLNGRPVAYVVGSLVTGKVHRLDTIDALEAYAAQACGRKP